MVAYGFKGKGILLHVLVDKHGKWLSFQITPANGVEWRQAQWLVKDVVRATGKTPKIIQGDKGYDCEQLRLQMSYKFRMGTAFPKRKTNLDQTGGQPRKRFVVERFFAQLQNSFRRLADCWEKLATTRYGFTHAAFIRYWMKYLILG
jgi:transposase